MDSRLYKLSKTTLESKEELEAAAAEMASSTRRDFLKTLGTACVAIAIAPVAEKLAIADEVSTNQKVPLEKDWSAHKWGMAIDVEKCIDHARRVNPDIQILALSARTGDGLRPWLEWLRNQRNALLNARIAQLETQMAILKARAD